MPRTNEHRAALAAIGDLGDIELALDANDLPAYLISNVTRLDSPRESARAFAFQLGLREGLDTAYAARLQRSGVTPEDYLSAGAMRWYENGLSIAEYVKEVNAAERFDDDDEDDEDECPECGDIDCDGECEDEDDLEYCEVCDDYVGRGCDCRNRGRRDGRADRGYRAPAVTLVALVADVETADIHKAVAGLRTLIPALTDQVGDYELGEVTTNGPTTSIELIPQGQVRAPISCMPAGQLVATLTSLNANDALVYNIRIAGGVDANRLPREPQANGGREVTRVKLTISTTDRATLSDAAAEAGLRFALVNVDAVLGTAVVVDTDNRSYDSRVYTLSLNNDGPRDARILNGACFFNAVHTFPGHGTLRARLSVA